MKCSKCGKEVQLQYQLPPDGIPFYCSYCFQLIIQELNKEINKEKEKKDDTQTELHTNEPSRRNSN